MSEPQTPGEFVEEGTYSEDVTSVSWGPLFGPQWFCVLADGTGIDHPEKGINTQARKLRF